MAYKVGESMKKLIVLIIVCVLAGGLYYHFKKPQEEKEQAISQSAVKARSQSSEETYSIKRGKYSIFAEAFLPALSKRVPTVIICNGYTATYKDYEGVAKKLQANGIAAIVFDFVGGSTKSKSDANMSDMTATSLQSDLKAVINYIKGRDYCDQKQFYLAGHSQGGLVAALVADHRSDIRSLFLVAPAFNIPKLLKYAPTPAKGKTMQVGSGYFSRAYVQSMKKVDIYGDVDDYTKPVYIFHGTADDTVNISYSFDAQEKYKYCKVYPYADQGHVFDEEAIDKMCNKVVSIIKK